MTKLFDKALEAMRRLPAESQDEVARAILNLVDDDEEPQPIEPGDLTAVLNGLAQARRKEFASDEEVEVAFRRFGGTRLESGSTKMPEGPSAAMNASWASSKTSPARSIR